MARPPVRLALAALALAVLPACGGSGGDDEIVFASATPFEPTAGTWRTWLLASPSAVRPPAPPSSFSDTTLVERDELVARAAARGAPEMANIDDWNDEGTCAEWTDLVVDVVKNRKPPPPKVARALALLSTAMYDAMVAAFDAKYAYRRARPSEWPAGPTTYGPVADCPGYASDRAAMSAAAAAILTYLFPLDAAAIETKKQSAFDADLDSCACFPSDVEAGRQIGEAVGALAVARAQADHGDDAQPTYTESGVPGRWVRTPQNNGNPPQFPPVLPGWGIVRCWFLADGSDLRPGAPPAYGSAEWNQARDYVLAVNQTLSQAQKDTADFWADGGGTATPPGHWAEIAVDACVAHALNDCRTARVLAYVNTAQSDAFVACWECKYHYDIERPVTVIRRDVGGQAAWLPWISTPPFPSYPSGHSSTSGAASTVLAYLLPDMAQTFVDWAGDAKDSRLFGGIHFVFDNDAGLDLGRTIGTLANLVAASDGAD
ncbi:MAG: phosphatase PAP2 family protein [Planctomycetes bacterium]|nr:phosphatase PAP2 family protein [Planctomycetota bacterium]